MQKRIFFAVILLLFVSTAIFAGTTGKLAGKVKDEKGDPVPYANVVIMKGETIITGTQTKENGQYMIINIPPGVYDVKCSQVGFKGKKITGVHINLDETTVLNISITSTLMEIQGVDVVASRVEMVSKTKTSSGKTVTAESIEDLGVDNIDGIVAIQAGATIANGELHIRGGRANEVVYTVDGMSVSDPVDGEAALTIDKDAIKDMKVMTGGFTAEFGNAQSGIVNIVTKDGGRDYSGKLEMSSDHLAPDTDNSNSDNVKFALGGPVLTPKISSLRDNFTFFFNIASNWHDSRYKDYYVSNPVEELKYLNSSWNTYEFPDIYKERKEILGFDIGNRNYNLYNANLKVKYKFNPRQNVTFSVSGDQNEWEPYSHAWKYALEHYVKVNSDQRLYKFTYDQTFNAQMNLKVKAGLFEKHITQGPKGISLDDYFVKSPETFDLYASNEPYYCSGIKYLTKTGLYDEDHVPDWTFNVNGQPRAITDFVSPGSIYGFNRDDENKVYTVRSDFEYQLNMVHGFKTGFEFMKHYIKKDQISNPWVIDFYRYDQYLKNNAVPVDSVYNEVENTYIPKYSLDDLYAATLAASGYREGYEAYPIQGAYYLQDKMEWEGMIVNAGMRFDFWYIGSKYKIFRDAGKYIWQYFDKDKRFQMMVSPRLGVSHPISEKSVLHFAYNYQNQLPQMQYIFTTATPEDAITNPGTILGKPDLKPQITVTYEVGLQHQLGEDYGFDITAYYKNIYNYITTEKVYKEGDETVSWYQLISEDYGSARGIDINIEKKPSHFISGSTSYSLSWANGNNSGLRLQEQAINLREFPLNWDMRHNFNFNINFRIGHGEEFYIPFTGLRLPWDNFSMNFLYNIASGTPYTPVTAEGNALETNSARKPHTENASLTINKKFNITEKSYMKFYVDINNLFDRRNVYYVYPQTGSPYYDGADLTVGSSDYVAPEVQYIHDLATKNPSNVSSGRTITFGMSFNW
ncbi:MAG: hypothetical protein DRZ79_01805 [Candidatus Cloacimonadota bacterium]|nr:MAG: hypothetical protein DRZ79_01805 [Candidatus Cloacimonadota bacterium]